MGFYSTFAMAPCTWKLAKPSCDMKQIFVYLPSDWDFLHESQKSSGFSSIKHSKAQGFGHDIEPPSENWFFCSEMVKLKKLTEELENNYSKLCH